MKEPWAALFVGGAVLLIGIILALIGTSRLKADRLLPDKTIHQVQRDISVARNQVRQSYDEQRAA
jgi:Putative Actinobacterial Holin-X, holin superfamily III